MTDRPFAGIAWDIDGTLIDSEPLHYVALQSVCNRAGRCISAEENAGALGLCLEEVWDHLDLGKTMPMSKGAWLEEVVSFYCSNVTSRMARPGAPSTVRLLGERSVPQVFVTTAERTVANANIEALGLADLALPMITRDDVPKTKPHPDPYLAAAAILGAPPRLVVAVEDTSVGCRSAASAGMYTLVWPNQMTEDLDFPDASRKVRSSDEIISILSTLQLR